MRKKLRTQPTKKLQTGVCSYNVGVIHASALYEYAILKSRMKELALFHTALIFIDSYLKNLSSR